MFAALFLCCCYPAGAWSNGGYSDDPAGMNGDGKLSSVDALMILQLAVK